MSQTFVSATPALSQSVSGGGVVHNVSNKLSPSHKRSLVPIVPIAKGCRPSEQYPADDAAHYSQCRHAQHPDAEEPAQLFGARHQ